MKRRIIKRVNVIMIFCAVLLSACGMKDSTHIEKDVQYAETMSELRPYNENMTWEQYTQITNDLIDNSIAIGDCFEQMIDLCKKYANVINSAETFDWSQYWDFRELKSNISTKCEQLLHYDDSKCSSEYQLCVDEFKNMAYEMLHYFAIISEERDVAELEILNNNIHNTIAYGMNQALLYQTQATIAYLEANNGDMEIIQELKNSIVDYSTSNSAHSTKSGVFTNSYGTATTKCTHQDCSNVIASSGDTNCCIVHSNKCLNCGKYIDEDAYFCINCLSGNTKSVNNSGDYSSNNAPLEGCWYTYFDGTICGNRTSNGSPLCDAHFKELNDTYNSLIGK